MRKSLNVQRFQKYGQLWGAAGQGGEDVGKCVPTSMRQTSLTHGFYELNPNSRHLWFYLLVQYITTALYSRCLTCLLSGYRERFYFIPLAVYDLKWQKGSACRSGVLNISCSWEQRASVGCLSACVMCSLRGGHRCYLLRACSDSVFSILSLSSKWTTLTAGERWPDC